MKAKFEGHFPALVGLWTHQRVHSGPQNFLRGFVGDLFDFHPPFSGRHEDNTPTGAVNYRPQIKLLCDVSAGFDINFTDRLPFFVGLVGHHMATQPVTGELFDLFLGFYQLHSARLAASAGVHLCFDHPIITTDQIGGFHGFLRAIDGIPLGYRQPVFGKELLALILVKIHCFSVPYCREVWQHSGPLSRPAALMKLVIARDA